jgi:hypothetical protein
MQKIDASDLQVSLKNEKNEKNENMQVTCINQMQTTCNCTFRNSTLPHCNLEPRLQFPITIRPSRQTKLDLSSRFQSPPPSNEIP